MELAEQVNRYNNFDIKMASIKLQHYKLPFDDETFDVIIMCEVLEHLNFNPLPLIKEINRIGKIGSLFYLSLPNQAQIKNRINMMRGRAVGIGVNSFFSQLDPKSPEITNGHWREYTKEDIFKLLEPMSFNIKQHYFFGYSETVGVKSLRNIIGKLMYSIFPSFKENQTCLAIKEKRALLKLTIPSTVHESIRTI